MSMDSVAVVAVPFPAQGHLNAMLHLSLQLASRGLTVHYAARGPHLRQARARVHGWSDAALRRIDFHALDVVVPAAAAPSPLSSFPAHIVPTAEAFVAGARGPVASLLETVVVSARYRRVVVLYDRLCSFAAAEAARVIVFPGSGEAFCVQCVAACYDASWTDAGQRLLRALGLGGAPHPAACMPKEFVDFIIAAGAPAPDGGGDQSAAVFFAGVVANTCRAVEGDEFVDAVAADPDYRGKRVFAVGPLNPLLDLAAPPSRRRRHECLEWLDEQPAASVLYVSFGTTTSMAAEQVAELAAALRESKRRFVWVLRDADREEEEEEDGHRRRSFKLPAEFTKQTEGKGVVVTGWAPQLEILAHGATGAFMSHCGWNSTMESLSHGKPMLAWPMHSDQPLVAELVCERLKAGVMVRPWTTTTELEQHGAAAVVTPAGAISEAIDKVMAPHEHDGGGEEDQGLAVRERAKELMEAIRAAVADGGSSRKDLDDFVAYIARRMEKMK